MALPDPVDNKHIPAYYPALWKDIRDCICLG